MGDQSRYEALRGPVRMTSLCVFTAGQDLKLIRASAQRVGIDLQTFDGTWKTFVDIKLRRAIGFLQTRTEQVAMWVDGHDSLILKGAGEIERRFFAEFKSPVVVSAEANCFPDANVADLYPPVVSGLPRYICAGGFIGFRKPLIETLEVILKQAKSDDDQREWTRAFLDGKVNIELDYQRRLYSSAGDGPLALTSDACVMHWNGKIEGRDQFWERTCTS